MGNVSLDVLKGIDAGKVLCRTTRRPLQSFQIGDLSPEPFKSIFLFPSHFSRDRNPTQIILIIIINYIYGYRKEIGNHRTKRKKL